MENKKFSQALHDWRKKKQLTQEDVANKLGVSRTIVSFLETGKQRVIAVKKYAHYQSSLFIMS